MKKILVFVAIILFSLNNYSQISFEKGYFITNLGERINCLIKNSDWRNNPTEFKYKLSEDAEIKTRTIKDIVEFGLNSYSKYKKVTVDIDRSIDDLSKDSFEGKANFIKETIFLKVLIEGAATLYKYRAKNTTLYFFNMTDGEVEQLVFKSFLTAYNTIGKNEKYKRQLSMNLKCESITMNEIKDIDYRKNDLIELFVEFNQCKNGNFVKLEKSKDNDIFNLSIRPGFSSSSLSLQNNYSDFKNVEFDNESSFRIGLEAEFLLPFNKNKWGVILEPTYQSYKSEKKLATQNVKIDYSSIEIPVGIRHYFFLNNDSKIFINALFIFDFSSESKIDYEFSADLDIDTRNNLAFGFGYNYNKKYSFELRFQTNQEITDHYVYWVSYYRTTSIILGYNIF